MPVPAPNLYPDFNVIRLSHVCQSDSHVYLRAMEERGHHSVILQKSDQPGTVEVMGFKTFDEQDLRSIAG